MKKHKIIITGIALLSLLLSGCNPETDSELDELINGLPAAQISDGKINYDPVTETENINPYSSVTGNVVSASSKAVTVNCGGKEYKFAVNKDTKIFGGEIKETAAVTITYSGDLSDKKLTAEIITVLNGESENSSSEALSSAADTESAETAAE